MQKPDGAMAHASNRVPKFYNTDALTAEGNEFSYEDDCRHSHGTPVRRQRVSGNIANVVWQARG